VEFQLLAPLMCLPLMPLLQMQKWLVLKVSHRHGF
jgi:hypothetical protein